jgi:HTH-type transcriptional regulator / antitoxin HipB
MYQPFSSRLGWAELRKPEFVWWTWGATDHSDQRLCEESTKDTGTRNHSGGAAPRRLLGPEEKIMKDDLEKFIEKRKRTDPKFAKDFESGYQEFKIGVLLRQAREQAGVTQEALARRTKTRKSAISRLENHAEDVRLSTIKRVARALGKSLTIELV